MSKSKNFQNFDALWVEWSGVGLFSSLVQHDKRYISLFRCLMMEEEPMCKPWQLSHKQDRLKFTFETIFLSGKLWPGNVEMWEATWNSSTFFLFSLNKKIDKGYWVRLNKKLHTRCLPQLWEKLWVHFLCWVTWISALVMKTYHACDSWVIQIHLSSSLVTCSSIWIKSCILFTSGC